MSRNAAVTDLVDRYLYAVGQELPRRLRADVVAELRSSIEDAIDDRARGLGREIDLTLAADVLTEMGRPGDVAARYHSRPQYLIGPALYPGFLTVIRIVAAALVGLVLLSVGLSRFYEAGGEGLLSLATAVRLIEAYFQMGVTFFGMTVLVFALIERGVFRFQLPDRRWDPRELPAVPKTDERASVAGAAVRIAIAVLLGTVVLGFPEWLGFVMFHGNRAQPPTFVAFQDIGVYLPTAWIAGWCCAVVALNLMVVQQRRWTTLALWLDTALDAGAAAILLEIALRSALHAPTGLPQIEAALRPLGMALYALPAALLLAVLVETIQLAIRQRALATWSNHRKEAV